MNLTVFQQNALMQFHGVRALTETGLARAIKAEKAIARNAIKQLVAAGMIRMSGSYEYVITHEGIEHLVSHGVVKPDPVKAIRVRKPKAIDEAFKNVASSETAALTEAIKKPADLPAIAVEATRVAETEVIGVDVQADGLVIQTPQGDIQLQIDQANDWVVDTPECDPSPQDGKQYNFAELVQRGLTRLTKQLNFQPVTMENKRLKLTTLTSLADTLDGFDVSLAAMLREIATDLNKLNEAQNG